MSKRGKWRDHGYESIFGTLAQWLFDDGAARSLRKGVRKEDEDCPENSTLREIAHIVAAYKDLSNKIVNGKAGWNLGRPSVNNLGRWTIDWKTPTSNAGKHEFVGRVRKATVVLFGVFKWKKLLCPTVSRILSSAFWLPIHSAKHKKRRLLEPLELLERSFLQHVFLILSASYHRGSHRNLLEFLSYLHLFFENTSITNL
jgi:hypothetical protein